MAITTDANGNPTITGNDNAPYLVPAGSLTVTVAGDRNTVGGGTGPNTYNVTGDANGITTGSGPATVNLTDTSATPNTGSAIDTGSGGLVATLNGSGITVTAGLGQLFVRGSYTNSSILVNGGNLNGNGYILSGNGNVLQGSAGDDTILIAGDASFTTNSEGNDTYVFRAGGPGVGPRIAGFQSGQDRLAILVNPAAGLGLGLTDLGLAPMSFLTGSNFERSATSNLTTTRFLYDPATGALQFSPQGSLGPTFGVARLPAGLNLQASDVFISNQFVYGAPTQTVLDVSPARSGYTLAVNPEGNGTPTVRFAVTDATTGIASSAEPGQVLTGDPLGLTAQFIYNGRDTLAIASQTAENVFIKSNGLSAILGGAGNDVLDGGLGSTFLTGGAGRDFFFTDARSSVPVYTTVTDFQAGEIVTLWGFEQGRDSFNILPREGAAGFEGVTIEAQINGATPAPARVTLSNRSISDFLITFGENSSGRYLAINSIMPA